MEEHTSQSQPTPTSSGNPITQKDLLTPGAVLLSGFIIAGAILMAGGVQLEGSEGGLAAQAGVGVEEAVVLGPKLYREVAEEIGVNVAQFDTCVQQRKYQQRVQNDYDLGLSLGITGTPGSFVNDQPLRGALPYQSVQAVIEAELAKAPEDRVQAVEVTEQDHIRGNIAAPVTIVEFSDFECPFCRRFHPTVQQALLEYGDQVRWVYKHFPLSQIHPQAIPAAEASECVAEQKGDEGFWEFGDALFERVT